MVLIAKSLEEMTQEIGNPQFSYYGIFTPEKDVENFEERTYAGNPYVNVRKSFIDALMDELNLHKTSKWEAGSAVALALENSLTRGHLCDDFLPVSIKVFTGDYGSVIRIRDSGPGFDFLGHIRERTEGKYYGTGRGTGILFFDHCGPQVSYEGDGSIVNILVK
jgi:hypothetical protein